MPRSRKIPPVLPTMESLSVDQMSRIVCNELNNWWKDHGEDAYYAIYKCPCCGHWFSAHDNLFYKTPSKQFINNGGFTAMCKACAHNRFDYYNRDTNDFCLSIKLMCHELDIPYNYDIALDIMERPIGNTAKLDAYVKEIDKYVNKIGFSYGDTLKEEWKTLNGIDDDVVEDDEIVIDSYRGDDFYRTAGRFFGFHYSNEELEFLSDQYDDWTSRNECKTKAQEELFKNICYIQLRTHEGHATKDDIKNLQDLMDSGNLKPKQQVADDLASTDTFGTLIRELEENDPIPEPSPEWSDVDGIGHWIRVYFLGHLCKMFGFENKYANEYDEEMAKYTVEPPTYDDDEASETISSVIFKTTDIE